MILLDIILEFLGRGWNTFIRSLWKDREERRQTRELADRAAKEDAALDPKVREQRKQDLAQARSR